MTFKTSHMQSHDVCSYTVTNIWVTVQACSTHGVPNVRMLLYDRVIICVGFPRHVLFFRLQNCVQRDFLIFQKCLGFWPLLIVFSQQVCS